MLLQINIAIEYCLASGLSGTPATTLGKEILNKLLPVSSAGRPTEILFIYTKEGGEEGEIFSLNR